MISTLISYGKKTLFMYFFILHLQAYFMTEHIVYYGDYSLKQLKIIGILLLLGGVCYLCQLVNIVTQNSLLTY